MIPYKLIDSALIERVLLEAQASPRRRRNFNFHDSEQHPCQRLINAVLPDSYIQPHRHLDPSKEEMLVVLRGRLGLVFFDEAGGVTGRVVIAPGGPEVAVNIPVRSFHTAVAFEPSVVFEAKAGPYVPHSRDEMAGFAPAEGSPDAAGYMARLKQLFDHA